MAQDHSNEPLASAPMDYREHQKTYSWFLWMVKYGTIAIIAILLGMLAGLIASWGIIGSLFVFLVSLAVLSYVLS